MPGRRPTPETLSSGRKLTTLTLARTFPDPPNDFWFSYPYQRLLVSRDVSDALGKGQR